MVGVFYDEPDDWVDGDGPYYNNYLRISGYGGIAFYCYADNGSWVKVHMVGDDREFVFEHSDVEIVSDDEFCHECGQIGCGW